MKVLLNKIIAATEVNMPEIMKVEYWPSDPAKYTLFCNRG
ncbi:hypothetical protein EV10_0679 [Prochlorococcus marinus str. SS51]|nr:hypothetical protein EV08_0279 [Prochlorococcus marinus str. SS2]KGG24577.1 hypothetical protein EV09_0209 [Prochlorococcus marinus str. SS35]KGG33470.1 hypothetical protein EV10_0679 [Prochlorococcus marinus str. SS51]